MVRRADCPHCPGGMRRVFSPLTGAHLATLNAERVAHTYRRGQALFYEGTAAFAVYCIQSGRVKLFKEGPHDDEIVIRTCESGDLMGLDALLSHGTHGATAEALEVSVACAIPRETLLDLMRDCPQLSLGIIERLAQRCRAAEEQLVQRTHERVAQRTARFLLDLLGDQPDSPVAGARAGLSVRREEMAQLIGTTPETLSRTLHRLALDGLIKLEKSEFSVLDLPALKRLGGLTA